MDRRVDRRPPTEAPVALTVTRARSRLRTASPSTAWRTRYPRFVGEAAPLPRCSWQVGPVAAAPSAHASVRRSGSTVT